MPTCCSIHEEAAYLAKGGDNRISLISRAES